MIEHASPTDGMYDPTSRGQNPDAYERMFEHTGIRIMESKDGAILFCDPGSVTGIRDSLTIEPEFWKQGLKYSNTARSLLRRLNEYLKEHSHARNRVKLKDENFSYSPQKKK